MAVFVLVFVFLIKCLEGHKSLGSGSEQLGIDPDITHSVDRVDKKFTDWKIYIVSCAVRLE